MRELNPPDLREILAAAIREQSQRHCIAGEENSAQLGKSRKQVVGGLDVLSYLGIKRGHRETHHCAQTRETRGDEGWAS